MKLYIYRYNNIIYICRYNNYIFIYIYITYTSVIYQYLGQSSAGSLCANDCHFDAQMAAALLFLIGYLSPCLIN